MKVFGLTGGAGSGKSAVAALLQQYGAAIIDTDVLAHQLSTPPSAALDAIATQFGVQFITVSGEMDRAAMRDLVLADPAARARLEAIFHPLILQAARQQLLALPPELSYAVLVVPLLFETAQFIDLIDLAIVVDCPETLQRQRLRLRPGLTETRINQLLAAQCSRAARLARADIVIDNSGDLLQLELAVKQLHARLTAYSGTIAQP
ncbi:dephospho-CoA kinase [Amantichitinum ursilacus]|uniref:Dephospho-CoA kinase n=1 Tax=Amantichitinum ursilacus TaxID=857265 RepID=A0A0N0XFW4_9NEIS|nr:dephospho-CoA kinase [Amantichitinum ursilacus]KPC49228.1 Dephospho-CoA kinase [Amantichitinum ursilacus]